MAEPLDNIISNFFNQLFKHTIGRINIELLIPASIISLFIILEKYPLQEMIFDQYPIFFMLWLCGCFIGVFFLFALFKVVDAMIRITFPLIIWLNKITKGLLTRRIPLLPPAVRYSQSYINKVANYPNIAGEFLNWAFPIYLFLRFIKFFPQWVNLLVLFTIIFIGLCYFWVHYLERYVNWDYQKPKGT